MSDQIPRKVIFNTRNVALAAALLAASLGTAPSFAAKADKNHQDAFVSGPGDESRIAREVRHQLVTQPLYGVFDDLAYKVEGSTVTLLGAVVNPVLKDDAEKSVKQIEGVTKVNDQIEVLPVSPMDDRVRRAVFASIYGDSYLSTHYGIRAIPTIHIIVKNGNVTLEGVVANQMDKQLVNTRANTVGGVFSVTNNLQVSAS